MGLSDDGLQEFPDDGDFAELDVKDEAEETELKDDEQIVPDDDVTVDGVQEDEPEEPKAEADEVEEPKGEAEAEAEAEEEESKAEAEEDPKPKKKRFNQAEYSKSVQKRINREVRKREELRAENHALNERLDKLEQNQVKEKNDNEITVMNSRIQNAQAMHTQYMEDGEYAQAANVLNDITDMKIYTRDLETKSKQPAKPEQPESQQARQPDIPEAQVNWMNGNERFNRDTNYTAYVNDEYDKLIDEGYAPDDQALYDQLDVVLGRAKAPAPKATPKPRRQAAPTPNIGEQAPPSNKKSLDKGDLRRMEDWGLDPNDVEARKEYLKNKIA